MAATMHEESSNDTFSSSLEKSKTNQEWSMLPEVRAYHDQNEKDDVQNLSLGLTWKNLSVFGASADTAIHDNVGSQFNIPAKIKRGRGGKKLGLKTILENISGCVKPGEMLLVLGRPGSGCTTLLNLLSNRRDGFAKIEGDVHFGTMDPKEALKYRGQIVMNTEEELYFPTLTVGETMDFATRMKVPFHTPSNAASPEETRQHAKDFLLRSMGIEHTASTKVGNEFVRGVSGGERKRVSIIETLATRGSIYCWDNSTRGLDASTALEYARALRALTNVLGLSTVCTLYQAGNHIYKQFDKVLVLDGGKQIFYGPMNEARPFMEELGFICGDGANIGDFLTGVTVPTERKVRTDMKLQYPRNAEAIRDVYIKSDTAIMMQKEFDYPNTEQAKQNTEDFKRLVAWNKHKSLPKNSPLTTSFANQVKACVIRQYQILRGDWVTFAIKQGSMLINALIAGSLFYMAPDNSGGLFLKGGSLFLSLLFQTLLAMSETTDSFTGRPVLAKHKSFAFYHPAAFCLAQVVLDIPITLFQVSVFGIILYFMVGLTTSASAFFTYWAIVYLSALCSTQLFRLIGAAFSTFDGASKVSGFLVSALFMYTGYMIPIPHMHPWFAWFRWINPLSYAFEALLSNEFHQKLIPCVGQNLIPSGPGYADSRFQACSGVGGAVPGATNIQGDNYLASLHYSHSHLWRNYGIVWVWWLLYVALTVLATNGWKNTIGGSFLMVPAELVEKNAHHINADEESQVVDQKSAGIPLEDEKPHTDSSSENEKEQGNLIRNTSIFTWKNLTYTVKTPSGDRVLLDNVQGWVKPGQLGALMGSSGAGKTTLLDVLAQRKTEGTIQGQVFVDGRPLSVTFQRAAGYCEQLDVHESMATVREALEFSALLRQSRKTPRAEKLKYVDVIIDLLELHDIEHTLIGRVGAGLSVEQRKRLTIGVELVSKPDILIFLDEPTSGLDGQAAYNTVRFLKKLAASGQAILVTIHQPSAQLFAQFDTLLLLAKGGKTVYFGDIGEDSQIIKEYFAREDAPCPPESNPAEHMIDVVSGTLSQGKDWNDVWLNSPEHEKISKELDDMVADAASRPIATRDDGHEFASPIWDQIRLVLKRNNISLWRNSDYINNKFALHIGSGLFNGFSFWMIGDSSSDLQLGLFTIFNFIFVAPGVLAQLQPLFINRRDIYETREKKSKMYHWSAFVTGLIVSEIPYLCICAVLYFVVWYYTVGFPSNSNKAGATLFVMLMYEFIYTGIGQFIAAYAPNAVFASLTNPILISLLVSFCGVLVPYTQLQSFWKYWFYYLDIFNYLMGSILTFTLFDKQVNCDENEFARFDPPQGQTCGAYLSGYLSGQGSRSNLVNPDATSNCRVCVYGRGSDYLYNLNLKDYYYGWRDAAICVIFVFSSYAMVYLLMKLRTKATKKAQ